MSTINSRYDGVLLYRALEILCLFLLTHADFVHHLRLTQEVAPEITSHSDRQNRTADAAAQQQQIQARIHQQRALAQSQNQARAPSSAPDTPNAAPNSASTLSSTTLEGERSIHSNNSEDEEKPHARGPEEIGADDLGPQSATSSTIPVSTTTGNMTRGIDIQAAVGRKPLDTSTSSKSEENLKDNDDDEMDIEETNRGARASTPKRDAEEQLGSSPNKKLKEDPSPTPADAGPKPIDADPEIKESGGEDAMDKD
ncbi:hypothetical protein NUW58_g6512 [Xylaria curta]|uniref:Uncharacterized protein n=1 Tax=Xylaria curta TaxID=42375 RepID=A0ACC1NS42_9PEZI|nr:hypothetical protein NUW58_g6512 [Xylaria curta]